MTIAPIARAIRDLKKRISDLKWANADATPLRTRLASLELMARSGEQWDVPF